MIDLQQFPIQEIPPGRSFFKKTEYFTHFYYLEQGKVTVIINQISIEIATPMFLGDYQIIGEVQFRISTIKSITKCKVRCIPKEQYNKFNRNHEELTQSFRKFSIKNKVLKYWIKKLFYVSTHHKNDVVKCQNSIGIVLQGEFKHASNIPIVNMRQRNFHLIKKFQISIIGQHQIFEESVVCQTYRGKTGILIQQYVTQLSVNYEEFSGILGVSTFKKKMHISMTRQIAKNCRKKRSLFQNMIPIPLKHSIQYDDLSTNRSQPNENKIIEGKKSRYRPQKLMQSDEVFTVKDNIAQFLHNQWRRGLSLSLPKKSNEALKLKDINSIRKKKIEDFKNPQMIQLSVPHHFKELKFNFKMLLKSKDNPFVKSKRVKTQPAQPPRQKLLFQD